jgi:uncharacterized protein (TIGR04255 family)
MGFKPVSEDHAVQLVEFEIVLNRMIGSEDLSAALRRHHRISDEVPAVGLPEGEDEGLEFSYRRPNGSSIWAARLVSNTIQVACTRYTRWEKIWTTAERLIREIASACTQTVAGTEFAGATLKVTDKFIPAEEDYDLAELFVESDILPKSIFRRGPAWHCNQGWFETVSDQGTILHQLQLSGRGESLQPFQAGPERRFVVVVQHVQQFRGDTRPLSDDAKDWLRHDMSVLHANNKSLLAALLVPSMQRTIGLNE